MAATSNVSGGLFGGPHRSLFSKDVDDEDYNDESKSKNDPADIKFGLGQSDEGKIVAVSVYFNRAEVARSYKFRASAGQHKVSVSGLPTVLDEDSIRVEGRGSATIQDVTVSKKEHCIQRAEKPSTKENDAPKTSPRLEELVAQMSDLLSELERYKKTLMALDWFLEARTRQIGSPSSLGTGETSTARNGSHIAILPLVDEYNAAAEKYDSKANAIRRQLKKLGLEIDEERKALEEAGNEPVEPKKKLDRKRLARVTISIYAEEETEVELILKYFVSGAGWDAAYDVRARTGSKEDPVEIIYKAAIQQSTGEDWTDVPITLETATPSSSFFVQSLPTLFPWNISLRKPAPPPASPSLAPPPPPPPQRPTLFGAAFGAAPSTGAPTGLFGQALFGGAPSNATPTGGGLFGAAPSPTSGGLFGAAPSDSTTAGGGLFGSSASGQHTANAFGAATSSSAMGNGLFGSGGGGLFGASRPVPAPEQLTIPQAEVTSQGSVNATFKVPGSINIPSDGVSHTVTIVSLKPTAKLRWMAIPSVDARAHLTARITNDSEFTLLRGVAGVFVDGTFITKSTVPIVSPGEPFSVALGLDPSVRLIHPPIIKQHRTSGLLTKTSLTAFTQRMTIHNTKSVGIENLKILARIPVSEDSQISVKLIEPSLALPPQTNSSGTSSTRSADSKPPTVHVKEGIVAQWCPNSFEGGGSPSVMFDEKGKDEDDEAAGPIDDLGKDGKIQWTCKVEARAKVELALRFEVAVPNSETVVGL